jgi:hypothetical protein
VTEDSRAARCAVDARRRHVRCAGRRRGPNAPLPRPP